MFCPKCGTRNEDGAGFCVNCGNMLSTAAPTAQAPAQAPSKKNPIIAALLNFFFPGIGYWYWGYRKVATVHPAMLFIGAIILELFIAIFVAYASIVNLAINVFLAYDMHVKTTGQRGWIEASM